MLGSATFPLESCSTLTCGSDAPRTALRIPIGLLHVLQELKQLWRLLRVSALGQSFSWPTFQVARLAPIRLLPRRS